MKINIKEVQEEKLKDKDKPPKAEKEAKKTLPVLAEKKKEYPKPMKTPAAEKVSKRPEEGSQEKASKNDEYTAKDIYVLKGLEPVRKRPAMYIGSTGIDGLHHLIWEVVDNSIDEAMAGHAKNIDVVLLPDNRVKISDDGRGIPVEKHADTGKSALETVMTTLHAGGKFGGNAYNVSGGLHGVGVSVVCALSTYMEVQVERDGGRYLQEYFRGHPKSSVKKVGESKRTGTTVTFDADPKIFPEIKYDAKKILQHLRHQAYLTKGVRVTFRDEREKGKESSYGFYFEGGVGSFVKYLVMGNTPRHDNIFFVATTKNDIFVEAAFQYTQEMECTEQSFANNIYTPEGGTHISGFRAALTRCLNNYVRREGFLKEKDENFSGDDVREGLTAVVSVRIRNPQFEGQTKAKLGNPEVKNAVEDAISESLADYLERNPSDAKAIIENCILAAKARLAAKAARATVLRKGILEGLALPGKLADCLSKDPEESELYIVEGDSAGGCLFGETQVALADGRSLSFIELVKEYEQGKKNYCYTIQEDSSIGIALISHPRKTKTNAQVIKVILDNGEEIICTPDHKFMLRDGSYKMAQDLTEDDSLMPLYRKLSEIGGRITINGYEMVLNPQNSQWIFTYLLSDRYNLAHNVYSIESGSHKHHIDFNKLDLLRNKVLLQIAYFYCKFAIIFRLIRCINLKILSNFRNKIFNFRHKPYYATGLLKYETICERFFNNDKNKLEEAVLRYNHKVRKIAVLEGKIDVYDIEVPGTHNFALSSGIFVHNSSKMARDRRFQAILPLRGKILNVERARLDKMLASKEIKSLIIALGTAVAEDFSLEKLRYHRIIIMTDADVDGSHIRTLLLTLFYRYFKPIMEAGYIYIAQPPLYKIQSGKAVRYAYTEEQREKIIKEIGKATNIQRYKGLGEMNAEELWETTMNPEHRLLLQVRIDEGVQADKTFDVLMGEEVEPRKKFIQTHAKSVKNLDV